MLYFFVRELGLIWLSRFLAIVIGVGGALMAQELLLQFYHERKDQAALDRALRALASTSADAAAGEADEDPRELGSGEEPATIDPVQQMMVLIANPDTDNQTRIDAVQALASYKEAARVHTRWFPQAFQALIAGAFTLIGAWLYANVWSQDAALQPSEPEIVQSAPAEATATDLPNDEP